MVRDTRTWQALMVALALAVAWVTANVRVARPAEGMEGALDGTVGGALVVSFDPGATDATGDMRPIEVDGCGTWCVPACGYVREGHAPSCWQATAPDGNTTQVPLGARVEGLVALTEVEDDAASTVDLSPFVCDGTLTLVAVWEEVPTDEGPDVTGDALPSDITYSCDGHGEPDVPRETPVEDSPEVSAGDWNRSLMAASDPLQPEQDPMADAGTDATAGDESTDPDVVAAGATDRHEAPCRHEASEGGVDMPLVADLEPGLPETSLPESGLWQALGLGGTIAEEEVASGPALRAASETDPAAGTPVAVFCTEDRTYPAGTLVITRTSGVVQEGVAQEVLDTCGNELFGLTWTDVEGTISLSVPWAAFAGQILSVTAVPGTAVAPTSVSSWFEGCGSLASVRLCSLDLSGCADLSSAFSGCKALTEVDAGSWDLSGATTLTDLFRGCGSLTELDVSGWDMRRVTTLSHAFDGCSSLGALDVSAWDTRRLKTTTAAFRACSSLRSIDAGALEMGLVTNASAMLKGCESLESLDLSAWSTPRLRNASHLLEGCTSLASADLSGLDTRRATDLTAMLPEGGVLRYITFGTSTSLRGAADGEHWATMPAASAVPPHTGRWVREATGDILAPEELAGLPTGGLFGTWTWEVGYHPLSLDLAGGTWPEGTDAPAWYPKETAWPLPGCEGGSTAPVMPGYVLAGWLDESGEVVTAIAADSTGPRTLTAVWEPCQVRVRVPVALTLSGAPTPTGVTLTLPADERPLVENLGETAARVSAAVTSATGDPLTLSVVVGDADPCDLGQEPAAVAVVAAGETAPIRSVEGTLAGESALTGTAPVGAILWTFSTYVEGGDAS